ncbi:protein fem-1 homolog B-like [Pollicipes pollicipes]|uniref:protein fem-1 homolog B-like n=1 Tax=Pollicipes pollicipes TaxID=41117 RepID=UPI0018849BE1|nr:protein fem-1 homolog B-like [Pollicipes pollicipes]
MEVTVVTDFTPSLTYRVFFAARDGMTITLYALLADKPAECVRRALSQTVEDGGQQCAALLIAARNGHNKAVKVLLEKFAPDIEQEGRVKFDDFIIEGASPLWCAAGAGHFAVVRTLVAAGADVNHPTATLSTPLRAACFDGRLDIVQFLVEHGADIHQANKYNNTCLMISAFKGHEEIVQYLLSRGAELDRRTNCGATALHFAAECGHVAIVELLLSRGAALLPNELGLTPPLAAAERTQAAAVRTLLDRCPLSVAQRVDVLELMGATFANDKDSYNLERAAELLLEAMRLREAHGLRKRQAAPVAAYENHCECQSLAELERIRAQPDQLHMEGLAIRERVLGPTNPEIPHAVIYRGAVFADAARFDRCLELWLRALSLKQTTRTTASKDLLRFAQVFSQMVFVGVSFSFDCLIQVLAACVQEIEFNLDKIAHPGPKDEPPALQEELESNMTTVLYMLMIANRLMPSATEAQGFEVYRSGYRLCQLGQLTRRGRSLLHMVTFADTPVDDFHTSSICKFPCSATARLLISCGADVNCRDAEGNTPLHLIVGYQKPISDFRTLHSIIEALVDGGAHIDACNRSGLTPFESATTGVAEIILRTKSQMSLKCLAARVVARHRIPYCGAVPRDLESFIELHGPAGHVDRVTGGRGDDSRVKAI